MLVRHAVILTVDRLYAVRYFACQAEARLAVTLIDNLTAHFETGKPSQVRARKAPAHPAHPTSGGDEGRTATLERANIERLLIRVE